MTTVLSLLEILLKLVTAVLLGGAVGWQREARDRPAGLRTHVLVCVGATVFALASIHISGRYVDNSRIAAQIASGIGFLGAGTILRHGSEVRGLTTAASLWAVAAIGICIAIGREAYWIAAMSTVVVLLTLTVLRRLEVHHLTRPRTVLMTLRLKDGRERFLEVQQLLVGVGVQTEFVSFGEGAEGEGFALQMGLRIPSDVGVSELIARVSALPGFVSVRCD